MLFQGTVTYRLNGWIGLDKGVLVHTALKQRQWEMHERDCQDQQMLLPCMWNSKPREENAEQRAKSKRKVGIQSIWVLIKSGRYLHVYLTAQTELVSSILRVWATHIPFMKTSRLQMHEWSMYVKVVYRKVLKEFLPFKLWLLFIFCMLTRENA